MKDIAKVIKENYYLNPEKLEQDYNHAIDTNKTFKKLTASLNLPEKYLMKYTTKLEETSKELMSIDVILSHPSNSEAIDFVYLVDNSPSDTLSRHFRFLNMLSAFSFAYTL